MKQVLILFVVSILFGCSKEILTQFPQEALQDTMITTEGKNITFEEILKRYKGKKIFIDVWASWCGDCIKSVPNIKALQHNNPDLIYLFLSLDRNEKSWKTGVAKHGLEGEHYYVKSGWSGPFGKAIGLDWIPRYMVIDTNGKIILFEAVKTDDDALLNAIKNK